MSNLTPCRLRKTLVDSIESARVSRQEIGQLKGAIFTAITGSKACRLNLVDSLREKG